MAQKNPHITFLFVTHSLSDAKKFCKRGIVMKNGYLVFDGDVKAAADFYSNRLHPQKRGQ